MYESFYGLTKKPFSILPDPNVIFWGRLHRMAFAMLQFGLINQAGFTVITGEIGAGKTTLMRHLLRRFGDRVTTGVISNTPHGRDELLRWILLAFKQPTEGDYLTNFKRFEDFLEEQAQRVQATILIIDEAQNLSLEALEEVRLLSNINTGDQQTLQLVLLGQPQLRDLLRTPQLEQFAQRVAVDFHLKRLEESEVPSYIEFRLEAVGATRRIFDNEACALIANASRGIPRVINILCDTALVYGYSSQIDTITGDIVREVIKDKQTYGVFPVAAT
jgi:type II secretory pathway predicted ATPase ExeA